MAFATANLTYAVVPVGPLTGAQLAAKMGAIVLPTDLTAFGWTFVSQVIAGVNPVTLVLNYSLDSIFTQIPLNIGTLPPVLWWGGSIVSSSDQDRPGGTGAQQVRIRDGNGKEVENVTLNGKTPVELKGAFASPLSLEILVPRTTAAPTGIQAGYVQLFTMSNLNGNIAIYRPPVASPLGYQGSIFSTSEEDRAGGIGARTVTISYLDPLLVPKSETITLNGSTPVNTVATDFHDVTNMVVTTFGSHYGGSMGTVSFRNSTNGTGGVAGTLQPSFANRFLPGITPVGLQGDFKFMRGWFRDILGAALQSKVVETGFNINP